MTAIRARARLADVPVSDEGNAKVALVAAAPVKVVSKRGDRLRVRLVGVPDHVTGPLRAGSRVATAQVLRNGKPEASVALITARAVPKATVLQRTRGWLGRTLTIILLCVLAACTVQLVLLRRRVLRRRRRRTGEPEAT
jgi:hypothetical protein